MYFIITMHAGKIRTCIIIYLTLVVNYYNYYDNMHKESLRVPNSFSY